MDIEKLQEIIKKRKKATKAEYDMQAKLHETDPKYAMHDYVWLKGRMSAFNEALGVLPRDSDHHRAPVCGLRHYRLLRP